MTHPTPGQAVLVTSINPKVRAIKDLPGLVTSEGVAWVTEEGHLAYTFSPSNYTLRPVPVIADIDDFIGGVLTHVVKHTTSSGWSAYKDRLITNAIRDGLDEVVNPNIAIERAAKRLYLNNTPNGGAWGSLLPETRKGWEYAAKVLAEKKDA